ncbi:FecR family protein [Pedobacter nototheniae]|uniref:FecR family protein n=1 Tax=Pedobacter nototheniae TaxID=2488994 RepID=UPI0029319A2C|nr:FecR domain-containing protein [Pedobacter nototheniae]
MEQNEDIKRLFNLYLEGKINAQQETILFDYLADDKNKDSEFHDIMDTAWLKEPVVQEHSIKAGHAFNEILNKIDYRNRKKKQKYQFLKYAASIAIVIASAFGWYSYQKQQDHSNLVVELLSKSTQKAERIKMILPDSTIVYLAGGSKLTWPARFIKGKYREIYLEGEAFFEVKRDTTSPFIVYSGKMQTKVLGTSFNIYAYPKDKTFSVTVRTGKVKVSENITGKLKVLSLLTPGMKLLYEVNTNNYVLDTRPVEEADAWIKNRFTFRNVTLANMFKCLERYYNVRFKVDNAKILDCRFNATFANKSITDVMEQIKIMSGNHIQYKLGDHNKLITIWGEGCK